jgi:PAS domain S-box-containing protein
MIAAVFNSVPGLLYLYTEDGRLIQWNRQHEEMTGYTSEELLGFRAQDWFDEENWAQVSKVIAKVFSEGYGQTELTLKRKNGEEVPFFATGARVMIDGKPHMVGIAIDISLRKKAEQELTKQRNQLSHLSRVTTLNMLSNSLAHELNQPLGAILRNAEAAEMFLQASSPDLEEVRAILSDIREDDQRAGEVIDRMRSQLKRHDVEHNLLDLNLLAGEVIKLVRPEADSRKISLALETGSSHPAVRGDWVQLQQVLLNLLLNAMDAVNNSAPDGRRVIVRVQTAGPEVEVAVSDTGQGIPADKLARVFDPFYTTKPNGLGMGLAISHDIIEAHGGQLSAKNNEAGGATFTMTLPAAVGGDTK